MIAQAEKDIRAARRFFIFRKRVIRYLRAGKLLHLVSLAGLLVGTTCSSVLVFYLDPLWPGAGLCIAAAAVSGFGLICFAQKDAICRFQNYKLAKDLFYENRFKSRGVQRVGSLFAVSKCQREAALAAAVDMDLARDLAAFYRGRGYRWYHLIPDRVSARLGTLMTRRFWQKTLFVPVYRSKYFLW